MTAAKNPITAAKNATTAAIIFDSTFLPTRRGVLNVPLGPRGRPLGPPPAQSPGTLWDALGRSGTPWDALGRSGTPWDGLGRSDRSGTLWDALGRSGTLWDALGRSGTLWDALQAPLREVLPKFVSGARAKKTKTKTVAMPMLCERTS